MKRKMILLVGLMLLTAYQGYAISDALAIPGEFETMWAMDLPRVTYFIGESVTFTVVAFASTDPTLMLPDQMAKITIRNDSLAEVYEAWITTNVNGSAPVTWDSGLEAVAGNYTIILDDLKGEKVVEHFMLLFNEETYWQVKVGLIEKELQAQYGYLTYLFAYNKFLEKKVVEMERKMTIFGILAFVTVMCALYVGMHELSGSKRSTSGLMSYPGKVAEILGFRSRPIVELDHEEIANLEIPENKMPPIYGHDFFCPVCDPSKLHPLTEGMLRDHLWAKHDRLHLKKDSIKAKWRARVTKSAVKAKEKVHEPIKPAFASVEKYQEEWAEEKTKEHFQARLDLINKQRREKTVSKADVMAKISQLKEELREVNEKKSVYKETSTPKPKSPRKVRMGKQLSGIPKVPEIFPAEIPSSKTLIDELFEKLNNEKVN